MVDFLLTFYVRVKIIFFQLIPDQKSAFLKYFFIVLKSTKCFVFNFPNQTTCVDPGCKLCTLLPTSVCLTRNTRKTKQTGEEGWAEQGSFLPGQLPDFHQAKPETSVVQPHG